MNKISIALLLSTSFSVNVIARNINLSSKIDQKDFNPATLLWYDAPAAAWEAALPAGVDDFLKIRRRKDSDE